MKHTCHAERCDVPVPPGKLMCRAHWMLVPKPIRDKVQAEFRPRQCKPGGGRPSEEWLRAARAAIRWVADAELPKP